MEYITVGASGGVMAAARAVGGSAAAPAASAAVAAGLNMAASVDASKPASVVRSELLRGRVF